MSDDQEKSLNEAATFAGRVLPQRAEASLGDERTVGDGLSGQDTIIDDIEIVDLESRYKIEGTLGQGGMGAVLLAIDTRLERKVAIKRILGEAAGNRMAVTRFLTEAKAIAALHHPNIVLIFDYGWAKDGPFLTMEYVDGGSLRDLCKSGPLQLDRAVAIACQLCDGLAKAHDQGIIHRDIKPANVLLTKDGIPKLADFGLAKDRADDHGQTMTGAVIGTPDFMPPEQHEGAGFVDHRSDLWSLAATVYQMVTGRSPRSIRFKDVHESMQDVLGKALEDKKEERYQSARELRDALRTALRTEGVSASPGSTVIGEMQEGQCAACGTVNTDFNRKFCRSPKCGAPMRVSCLKCDRQIPVWDAICGECGGNQPQLLTDMRLSLESKRTLAESMLAAYRFDEAAGLASDVTATGRREFHDLAEWAKAFLVSTAEEQTRQQSRAADQVQEALAHLRAYDYPAAIHSLEAIPEPLRTLEASSRLLECHSRQHEATQLLRSIAERINRKDIEGLLPHVERAVELRGDRADVLKIRQQLVERRDFRLARAQAALNAGDVPTAARALAGAAADDFGSSADLVERVNKAVDLEHQLVAVVKDAKADGVISEIEAREILRLATEYLAINPKNDKVQLLVRQCQKIVPPLREEKRQSAARQSAVIQDDPDSISNVDTVHPPSEDGRPVDGIASCNDLDLVDLESRYRRDRTLGEGGMGIVYLATDTRLNREVAIKQIRGACAGDQTVVSRFLEQSKWVAAINHPNIVQIYDYGRSEGGPFLVMEYVEGGSLLDRCRSGPIPLDRAIGIVCHLCEGLEAVHGKGIVHRDIKPANVLLTKDGIPKLADFSLAWKGGRAAAGAVIGTPDFMAPEQRKDARLVDHRSDLWSLAATSYQMMTGRSPKVLRLHELPQALQGVLGKALAETKDARFQSALELREAFEAVIRETRQANSQPTPPFPPAPLPGTSRTIRNSIGVELTLIPVGAFTMGKRTVRLTKPYFIGLHPITVAQWEAVMGVAKSHGTDANCPVEQVNWDDASAFCQTLSAFPDEVWAGRAYRLPTEAEWEHACRAGTTTHYSFGDDNSRLDEYAWFSDNSSMQAHPVGRKKPNAWGLYDMHGNVKEWVSDWYGDYPKTDMTDPPGPATGTLRVRRGGGWNSSANDCRSGFRGYANAAIKDKALGFRVVMIPIGAIPPKAWARVDAVGDYFNGSHSRCVRVSWRTTPQIVAQSR